MYIILNILETLSKIVRYLIIGVSVILLPGVLAKEGAYNVAKHGAMEVFGGIMLMHVIPLIIFAILYVWIEPKLEARLAAMEEFEEDEEIEAHYNRGNSKYDSEDYKGAIADYTKAIELDPNYADAYYGRGASKLMLNQKDSGCLDLSKAGELGNEDAYDLIREHCN